MARESFSYDYRGAAISVSSLYVDVPHFMPSCISGSGVWKLQVKVWKEAAVGAVGQVGLCWCSKGQDRLHIPWTREWKGDEISSCLVSEFFEEGEELTFWLRFRRRSCVTRARIICPVSITKVRMDLFPAIGLEHQDAQQPTEEALDVDALSEVGALFEGVEYGDGE